MRLINTETRELEEFFDAKIPVYAILSHTWGEGEISYQQFCSGKSNDKIKGCCVQAANDGYKYVWIDTCWSAC